MIDHCEIGFGLTGAILSLAFVNPKNIVQHWVAGLEMLHHLDYLISFYPISRRAIGGILLSHDCSTVLLAEKIEQHS